MYIQQDHMLGLMDKRPRPVVRATRVSSVRQARVRLGMFGLERLVERRLGVGIQAVEHPSFYKSAEKDAVPYWKAYRRYIATSPGANRTSDLVGLSVTRVVTKRETVMFGLKLYPVFEESLIIRGGDDVLTLGTIVSTKKDSSHGLIFNYSNSAALDFFGSIITSSASVEAISVSFVVCASSSRAIEVIAPLFLLMG